MAGKKFYWLKLKRDFFKRHDIRIIEEMPNGKDYILFYLKMLLESIDHGGHLRFNETIPYNEQMLSVITSTNIDLVRSAMKVFLQLKMVEILDDETIYMTEVRKMTGAETAWAEKKRLYRERQHEDKERTLSLPCPPDVRQEIEIEKELEIDTELDTEIDKTKVKAPSGKAAPAPAGPPVITLPLNDGSDHPVTQKDIDKYTQLYPAVDVMQELRNMFGWLDSNPTRKKTKKGISRFVNSWLAREQDRGGRKARQAAPAKMDTLGVLNRMLDEAP